MKFERYWGQMCHCGLMTLEKNDLSSWRSNSISTSVKKGEIGVLSSLGVWVVPLKIKALEIRYALMDYYLVDIYWLKKAFWRVPNFDFKHQMAPQYLPICGKVGNPSISKQCFFSLWKQGPTDDASWKSLVKRILFS